MLGFRPGVENELWFALIHNEAGSPLSVGTPKVRVADVLSTFSKDFSVITLKNAFPQLSNVEIASCFCAAAELRSGDPDWNFERMHQALRTLSTDLTRRSLKEQLPDLTNQELRAALQRAASHYRSI